ncbi:hypothetical protein H4R99_006504 [Coemansia sp. RSA 1722]|nr:hypothetical protein IWW45_008493 [Coemansia sp. RSA 485]KAJ2592142.1 hypothetical protein H4R99_006504 [Coemansia sp. RSA 1722]KAJ2602297.1 hypothetical protein GGF39_000787 [Coemansia sp. RSA 1721]KAJ2640457.1 hypothetical protein GGF40_000105 [Coemansia sp. RSA 1286]
MAALVLSAGNVYGQQCSGNTAVCPGNQDGVSSIYLQCDSWSHMFVPMSCPAGLVCYANPNRPGGAICGLPETGGVPSQGRCIGNVARCSSESGKSSHYYQCDSWARHFVNARCPYGLRCYSNPESEGVFCA